MRLVLQNSSNTYEIKLFLNKKVFYKTKFFSKLVKVKICGRMRTKWYHFFENVFFTLIVKGLSAKKSEIWKN